MEENNRKGPGVFYAVVGVATLVVAIIGATFAYFSATTGEQGADVIRNQTMKFNDNTLSLTVTRLFFDGTNPADDHLVPAWFGSTGEAPNVTLNVANPGALQPTQVSQMIQQKCQGTYTSTDGTTYYTGCHVYEIKASTNETVNNANLLLDLDVTIPGATNAANGVETGNTGKDQWGYVVFTASTKADAEATLGTGTQDTVAAGTVTNLALNTLKGAPAAIGNGVTDLDIHNNQKLEANKPVTYYLLVYVNDINESQNHVTVANPGESNETTTGDIKYAVGSYAGDLELQVMGGVVRASFAG